MKAKMGRPKRSSIRREVAATHVRVRLATAHLLTNLRKNTADEAILFLWKYYCERRKIEKREEKQRTRELEMNLALVQATLEATQKLPQPDPEEEPRT